MSVAWCSQVAHASRKTGFHSDAPLEIGATPKHFQKYIFLQLENTPA